MKKEVLFLCTGNSCRSQMAEGYLRSLAESTYGVFSAGVEPTEVNPLAIKVMSEVAIDISKQRSKSVTEFSRQKFDYVITVCDNAKQACPVFIGDYKKIHWDLEDPAKADGSEQEKLAVFREIRTKINKNVLEFLRSDISAEKEK